MSRAAGTLRILLVDAQDRDRQTVREALSRSGSVPYEFAECRNAADAHAATAGDAFDAVVLDYRLPDQDGIACMAALKKALPDAAFLVFTHGSDAQTAVRAMKAGASDCLVKEQALRNPAHLDWAIYMAVYTKRLEGENARLMDTLRQRNQELEALNKRLWELSLTDELTNVYNRRYITSRLEEEIARSIRYRTPLSIVMLDLDFFKEVNDRFGHMVGDRVLREVAALLQSSLRDTDLVGRFGGEEFLLVLPNTDSAGAEAFCNRLRERLQAHPLAVPNGTLHITGSFGVAQFRPEQATTTEFLQRADQHLYLAKERGRNCVIARAEPAEPN